MATPSGQISMADVVTELGVSVGTQVTLNDTNVRKLAGVNYTWTSSATYSSIGNYQYTVPSGVNSLKVVTSGKVGYLSVTPGQILNVGLNAQTDNNYVGSLIFNPTVINLGSWSGNVDHTQYITVGMSSSSGTSWSASGGQSTLSSAASAVGAYYQESSEGNHGDLSATVSFTPLLNSSLVDGALSFSVTSFSGRGSVSINQQPNSSNSFRGVVYIYDGGYSEGSYSFNFTLTYNGSIEIFTSPYTIGLNDLKSKTWLLPLTGTQSSAGCYSAQGGFSVDRLSDGNLYLTMGVWPTDPPNCQTCDWHWLQNGSVGNSSSFNSYRAANNIRPYWDKVWKVNISAMTVGQTYDTRPDFSDAYGTPIRGSVWPYSNVSYTYRITKTASNSIKIVVYPNSWGTGDTGTSISVSNWWNNILSLSGGTPASGGGKSPYYPAVLGSINLSWTDLGY